MLKLSCKDARPLDLVDYLASLGHHPQKIRNQDYWYLSPLRQERTPSFKVSRRLNMWYDHGIGKGGNLIDFGLLYFNCPISDFLQRLAQYQPSPTFSFHPPAPASFAGEKKEPDEDKIVVVATPPLNDAALLGYIHKRRIPVEIARRFCEEVDFLLYGKKNTAIGFRNEAGGYELRSEYFKGSSSPKDVTFINNGTEQVSVFEGFFSFLSFQSTALDRTTSQSNCLILNSLFFFEKSRPRMEQHQQVQLFLDRDTAGISHTKIALKWGGNRYIDRSDFYQGHKDLNDWLISQRNNPKESQRRGKGL
ncbi:CHC2 zinc finger domain-containing protein [Chitinophaga polysaccharea]|uniref:CHC2 zinc finger domain-containing protein n=1 Tax=Chitinophaga polysaccharea TaxID=1293035 RepID=UPI00115709DC|nr:CHC2 zinc finger domain-containing protein [Chitinophaga polysaccharea]